MFSINYFNYLKNIMAKASPLVQVLMTIDDFWVRFTFLVYVASDRWPTPQWMATPSHILPIVIRVCDILSKKPAKQTKTRHLAGRDNCWVLGATGDRWWGLVMVKIHWCVKFSRSKTTLFKRKELCYNHIKIYLSKS